MSKIVFLGVEGSGKTSLTMALARTFESHRSNGWYLKPLSRDSFRFLKTLPERLDVSSFPHQTSDLRELSWQVEYNDRTITDISVLDYPGEIYRLAFLDEKDERDPEAFRQKIDANRREIDELLNAVKEARHVFVLFNLSDAVDLGSNPRNLDAVWVTNACLHLLKKFKSKPDIHLLLTQADKYRDAGKDLTTFTLDEIDLLGHDHKDIPWCFVSVIDPPESAYGVDVVAKMLFSFARHEGRREKQHATQYILGNPPLRHLDIALSNMRSRKRLVCAVVFLILGVASVICLIITQVEKEELQFHKARLHHNKAHNASESAEIQDEIQEIAQQIQDARNARSIFGWNAGVCFAICWILAIGVLRKRFAKQVLILFSMEQWFPAVAKARSVSCFKSDYIKYYLAMAYLFGLGGIKVKYHKTRELLLEIQNSCKGEVLIALGYMAEKGLDQPENEEKSKKFYQAAESYFNQNSK